MEEDPVMTAPLGQYLKLRTELARIRGAHAGFESPEEDALLDRMDEVWAMLSEADRAELERRPYSKRQPRASGALGKPV